MFEIPRRKLLGMTMAVFGFFTTLSPVEIERKNRVRVTKVQAGVQHRVLGDEVRDIRERMVSLDLPPGVSIEWGGEVEEE
jgi:HAE1 family hydrophobic/amphiphilic exporter-1